jgi:hypothetical protein
LLTGLDAARITQAPSSIYRRTLGCRSSVGMAGSVRIGRIRPGAKSESPHGTATIRWPVKCRRGHHGVQTRGAGAADHGIDDERHARRRIALAAHDELTGCPVTGRCRLFVNCAVSRGASWPGQRTSRTLPGVCNFTARPRGATTMQTDAHSVGREERRALLEQRRAAVARQLRRLAIELTDLDRQLDEIEQSER